MSMSMKSMVDTSPEVAAVWDLIVWKESYCIGHPGIDDDHRRLVGMINRFTTAVNDGQAEIAVRPLLDALKDYACYHFQREEQLMLGYDYPDYARHKRMHDKFERQIHDVAAHLDVGTDMGAFLLSFLSQWLTGHILTTDRALGDFLGEKGVLNSH